MKNVFFLTIFAMGVFFLLGVLYQILWHKKKPEVRYLCNVCGKYDCECHKE